MKATVPIHQKMNELLPCSKSDTRTTVKVEKQQTEEEEEKQKDHPIHTRYKPNDDNKKEKRGMKPRSKRNRKRPRSELHIVNIKNHTIQVYPLELDGEKIPSTTGWIRMVEPYPYVFSTFAKARWLGRTVLDVYSAEFGSYPKSYYETAIVQGRIMVSDQTVDTNYLIKGGDVLTHTVHRHEPGIAVHSPHPPHVNIISESNQALVVDKPGTMPIHPCGGYHIQSLMNVLEPQFGKLYTIHRLDRLTSGLCILGKTSCVAQEWGKSIMHRNCQKVYLARVVGKFPLNCPMGFLKENRISDSNLLPDHGELKASSFSSKGDDRNGVENHSVVVTMRRRNALGYWITDKMGNCQSCSVTLNQVFECRHDEDAWLEAFDDNDDTSTRRNRNEMFWFHVACPTRIAQPKDGICEAGNFEDLDDDLYIKTVKPAETSFGVVRYDPMTDSTVILCRPKTGRTHQIRLHLQYLGHTIANDPNYGGDIWYGNPQGKKCSEIAQERLDAMNVANQEESNHRLFGDTGEDNNTSSKVRPFTAAIDVPATEDEIQNGIITAVPRQNGETIHDFIQRTCVWCARSRNGGTDRTLFEVLIRSPGIWLHALQYKFTTTALTAHDGEDQGQESSFCFRAPLPIWHKFDNTMTQQE